MFDNLKDHREIQKPKIRLGQFVGKLIIKVFSKGDSTNYSYNLYTITETLHDTILSYRLTYLPETYNKNILLPTKLFLEENNLIMKQLNLNQ